MRGDPPPKELFLGVGAFGPLPEKKGGVAMNVFVVV